MNEPLAVSIHEACHQLGGISRNTIYRLIDQGQLDQRKIGCRTVITMASVKALLGQQND